MTRDELNKLGPEKHLAVIREMEGKLYYQIVDGEKSFFFQTKKNLFLIPFADDNATSVFMLRVGFPSGQIVYLSEIELIKSSRIVKWFKNKFSKKQHEQLFI